jgi:hypothetical protein
MLGGVAPLAFVPRGALHSLTSYSYWSEPTGHASEVLGRCCHQEPVSGAAYASQPQSIELQDAFQVGKQHLHLLSLPARLLVGGRRAYSTRDITSFFVDAAGDLAMRCVRAALLL